MIFVDQISILKWFLKDHVTPKTGVMAAEITGMHDISKYIKNKIVILQIIL